MKKPRRKIVAAIAILALSVGISSCAMESPKLLTAQADTPTAEGVCNPSFTAITSEIEEESLGQVVVEDFSENCTSSNSIYPNLQSFHLGKVGYYMYEGQNTAENPGVLDVAYTLKDGVTLTAGETYYLSMDYTTGWSADYNVDGKATVLLREELDASATVALEIAEIDVSVEVDEDNRIFSFVAPDSGTYYLGFDLTGSLQGQLYRFNVGDIAIGQNFHSYSGDCATTCENCESLRTVSVNHTLVNGICSVCGEEIKIVVNMADDYGDGWNGAALEIYADGELISSETMPDNEPEWSTSIPYDKNTTYVFKWTKGTYDNECAFTIIVDGEEKFSVDDCRDYRIGETVYTIESQCAHTFDEDSTTCTVCERTCGEQFSHSFEGTSVCAACGFECGVTENHDWSNKDGVCVLCSTVCEHSFVDYVCTICNYAYAAGVIKENETEYTAYQTLSEAFLVAAENENSTVFLLTDVSLDDHETVDSGKFTIDLNGYTWTSSSWALFVKGNAWLTITDTSEAQSGLLTATYGGRSTVVLIDSATLEIAGGTICHEDGQQVVSMDNSGNPVNSNLILSGGAIKGYGGISADGNSVTAIGTTMDIERVDIYWHQGTLDLSQYQNPHGMLIDIYHEDMTANPLFLPDGYALDKYSNYTYNVVHTAHEGGEATCTAQAVCTVCGESYGEILAHEGGEATCKAPATCTVCGESYGELVEHEADENGICKYGCGMSFSFKVNEEYYVSLSEALLAAAEIENSTVLFLTDISLDYSETISSGKFTIDLNGYTWTSSSWGLFVAGNSWVTFTDTSEAQSGAIVGTNRGCVTIKVIESATLEIAGGTITHEKNQTTISMDNSGRATEANLILSGGVIKGMNGILAYGNSVTITGGTIDVEVDDIDWRTGTLDLSQCQNPHGMTIYVYNDEVTTNPPLLPDGYAFVKDEYIYKVEHTAHEGGEATCTMQAVCAVCGESYGELAAHEYDNACDGNCNVCKADTREPAAHEGGEATCTMQAVCTVCGESYGGLAAHEYDNACDGNCNVCKADTREPAAHEGGEATCTTQAVCTVCGESYGELAAHEYDNACDGNCNVCKADTREPAAHVDADSNGKCDVCTADVPVVPPVQPDDSSSDENSSDNSPNNSSSASSSTPVAPPATSTPIQSESSEKEGCSGTVSGLSVAMLALSGVAIFFKKRKEN